jgi:hypothetical protein
MPGNQRPRSRKHRGTQTGSISRSRRARPRNRQEAMAQARSGKKGAPKGKRAPVDRRDQPPTWSGAIKRGLLFAVLLLPVSLLFGQKIAGAIVLTIIAAIFYIPLGYVTEKFFYERRLAKAQKERAARQAEKGK